MIKTSKIISGLYSDLDNSNWHHVPSIINYNDKILMAYRRDFYKDNKDSRWTTGSQLRIVELDDQFNIKDGTDIPISWPREYPRQDPRLFQFYGKLFCSYTSLRVARRPTVKFCELDGHTAISDYSIRYRKQRAEKNWQFFRYRNALYTIYSVEPHRVLKLRFLKGRSRLRVKGQFETDTKLDWKWRGFLSPNNPPILHEGQYWVFFHSYLSGRKYDPRKYYTGAYTFNPKPPFKITSYSTEPIFVPGEFGEPKEFPNKQFWGHIVYPAGAYVNNGKWTLSVGNNETECIIVQFSHSELKGIMKSV